MNPVTPASQSRIFEPSKPAGQSPQWRVGDSWIDLYVLLGVAPDASPTQIEEAILERGADCLSLGLSRGGKPDFVRLLEQHLPEFRPVLLLSETRRDYDELLARHRAMPDAPDLPNYAAWIQALPAPRATGCMSALIALVSLGVPFAVVAWRATC